MKNAVNFQHKKMTTSINVMLLKTIDQYAAEHYIPRAYAIHLLLMEAMKMEGIKIDTETKRIKNTVKIVVSIPVVVASDLEEYITKNNFKTKTVGIYTLLTAILSQKGYWDEK